MIQSITRRAAGAAACLLAVSLFAQARDSLAGTELVMFEEAGCSWCLTWREEIGPIYPKTEESRVAPLRRVDIHAPRPEDLKDIGPVHYTPTFVLMHEGREVGRILGHPGEDFFWALLAELLEKLPGAESAPATN